MCRYNKQKNNTTIIKLEINGKSIPRQKWRDRL
jgi:hypothetical protein